MMHHAMKTTHLSAATAPMPITSDRVNRRILVPLNLGADSHRVLRYTARLAKEEDTSVCLLHVVDFGPFKSAMAESPLYHSAAHIMSRAERYLRMLVHRELPPGVPIRIVVRAGKTAPEVVKEAIGICADLILLSSPRQSWLSRLFSGDVTRWIESHAPCSVVVLREPHYSACDCSAKFESRPFASSTIPA
jgi:nucleotide-binding universal stress UspA family protein